MDRCQVLVISTHIGVLKYIPGEDMKSIWRVVLHMERNFFKSFLGRSVLLKNSTSGLGFFLHRKLGPTCRALFHFSSPPYLFAYYIAQQDYLLFFCPDERRLSGGSCMLSLGWRLNTYICIIRKAACSVRCCCASPPPTNVLFPFFFSIFSQGRSVVVVVKDFSIPQESWSMWRCLSLFSLSLRPVPLSTLYK
jgi:hypothetical protein